MTTTKRKKQKAAKDRRRDAIPRNLQQAELRETSLAVAALSRRERLPLSVAARIEGIKGEVRSCGTQNQHSRNMETTIGRRLQIVLHVA